MTQIDGYIRKIRMYSGIVIFIYVIGHLINHSLGLISIYAMDTMRLYVTTFYKFPPVAVLLYGAIFAHMVLAFYSILRRRTFKMSPRDWVQAVLGFLMPWLLIGHVIIGGFSTRFENLIDSYELTVLGTFVFDPKYVLFLMLAVIGVWVHGVIGIVGLIQFTKFYEKWKTVLLIVSWLLPTMALLGYASAGKELLRNVEANPEIINSILIAANFTQDLGKSIAFRSNLILYNYHYFLAAFGLILFSTYRFRKIRKSIKISYPKGKEILIAKGTTILEASREHGIPHVAMCGGRGRCSTCRVLVKSKLDNLPIRNDTESLIANRLGFDDEIRLACQLRPTQNVEIRPLVDAPLSSLTEYERTYLSGTEKELVIMFIDLRNFTPLSEKMLPYDTVYLLNQYFKIAGEAIEDNGGRIDKFIGDGIMALFLEETTLQKNSENSLIAASRIAKGIKKLSLSTEADFDSKLAIGIGIHVGNSVVGSMGYGDNISETAIGDSVNVASRLEQLTKQENCELIVSEKLFEQSEVKVTPTERKTVEIKGKSEKLSICSFVNASMIPS